MLWYEGITMKRLEINTIILGKSINIWLTMLVCRCLVDKTHLVSNEKFHYDGDTKGTTETA